MSVDDFEKIMEDHMKLPKYYNLDEEKGLGLQWLKEAGAGHLSGVEADNVCNIFKYGIRYGKKTIHWQGKADDALKIATFGYLLYMHCKKEIDKEKAALAINEENDVDIDNPLYDSSS